MDLPRKMTADIELTTTQPIYLLADSMLLFRSDGERSLLHSIREAVQNHDLRAVYVGASNGDRREYFSILAQAMELVDMRDYQMISSRYAESDRRQLRNADIILLTGGDVGLGWQIIHQTALGADIVEKHRDGAVLMGVSAGAVQPFERRCVKSPGSCKTRHDADVIMRSSSEHAPNGLLTGWARSFSISLSQQGQLSDLDLAHAHALRPLAGPDQLRVRQLQA